MWNRKDLITVTLAATATFGLTLATFLPRVADATSEQSTVKVISPVLHLTDCDVQAQADSLPVPTPASNATPADSKIVLQRPQTRGASNLIRLTAGAVPTIKLTAVNTSDHDTSTSFTASFLVSSGGGGGRRGPMYQSRWSQSYDLVLKAHESRDIEVDTQATLDKGNIAQLTLQAATDTPQPRITALSFNVAPDPVPTPAKPVTSTNSPVAAAN